MVTLASETSRFLHQLIPGRTRQMQSAASLLIVIKTEKHNWRYVLETKKSQVRLANESARRRQTKYSHTTKEIVGSLKPRHCSHRDF